MNVWLTNVTTSNIVYHHQLICQTLNRITELRPHICTTRMKSIAQLLRLEVIHHDGHVDGMELEPWALLLVRLSCEKPLWHDCRLDIDPLQTITQTACHHFIIFINIICPNTSPDNDRTFKQWCMMVAPRWQAVSLAYYIQSSQLVYCLLNTCTA